MDNPVFNKARWIWENHEPQSDEYAEFTGSFQYTGGKITLRMSCDSNYFVLLNGQLVGFEQYPDYPYYKIYDDIDLTLQHEDDIAAYEKMRAEKFPFKPKTIPAKHWAEERIESAREPEDADWTGPLAALFSRDRPAESPVGFQQALCRAATAARPALSLAERRVHNCRPRAVGSVSD